jgi:hypothetical protein
MTAYRIEGLINPPIIIDEATAVLADLKLRRLFGQPLTVAEVAKLRILQQPFVRPKCRPVTP